jgi:formylglycine-generating enzyme required for sulfatase activity
MANQRMVDITELATLSEQFPLRLMQLGFRLMQVIDAAGRDLMCYVQPPICAVPMGVFLMGSDQRKDRQAYKDELPQRRVTLKGYHIA